MLFSETPIIFRFTPIILYIFLNIPIVIKYPIIPTIIEDVIIIIIDNILEICIFKCPYFFIFLIISLFFISYNAIVTVYNPITTSIILDIVYI